MANTLLTPKVYANTMLKLLKNNLVMGKLVTTQFNDTFKKVGQTIYVKRPPEFQVRDGAVAQIQAVTEGEVPITMNKQKGVDIQFSSIEDVLTVTDLLKNSVMQAEAAQLAQQIDSDLMSQTLEFPAWVGTPGNTIANAPDFFQAPQLLDMLAVPSDDRNGVLSPIDQYKLAGTFQSLYAQKEIAITALEKAEIPMIGDVRPVKTQSIINLKTGTRVAIGAAQVNGAGQNVAYTQVNTTDYAQPFLIKGLAAGATIRAGEVFMIAGVNWVNPRTKADIGYVAQFVVLADATADGGGNVTVTIANPIIATGAFQNVTAAPANSAAITFLGAANGTFRQNAVFHKSAIALVFAKLTMPFSGEASYATDPETGVSIRYWRTSDGINDTHMHRWDVLYGVKNVDRRLGTRLSGQ